MHWPRLQPHPPQRHAQPAPARHWCAARGWGVAVGPVLVLHLWVLGGWPDAAPSPGPPRPPAQALQVRQIVLPVPLPDGKPALARQLAPVLPVAAAARAGSPALPHAPAPRGARLGDAGADPGPTRAETAPVALTTQAAEAMAWAAAELQPPPLYATRLPPAFNLHYTLQRDGVGAAAWLSWQTQADDAYRLSLHSQAGGSASRSVVTTWTSEGLVDSAGLAPVRYAEGRGSRESRAANFQRQARRISFSGSVAAWPLVDGVQDRLSWMVQLGAVLAANPALAEPGARLSLLVVGTRGEAQTWTFVPGAEPVAETVPHWPGALHLRRDPQQAYDLQVDVWLDPAMHFLPVRLRLQQRGTRRVLELNLEPEPRP